MLTARSACRTSAPPLLCSLALLAGCDGDVLNLGSTARSLTGGAGGGITAVWNVESEPVLAESAIIVANGTLDAEASELFYSRQTRENEAKTAVYRAEASGSGFNQGEPMTLGDWATGEVDEVSPAVSLSGDELWLGSSGIAGDTDIYVCTGGGRTWTTPTLVAELSSEGFDDAPRPPAVDGTVMPLSSKRHGGKLYQIYLSIRPDRASAWTAPTQEGLVAINSASFQSADGFLSADGLELYFASNRDAADELATSDLYVARRPALRAAFGSPQLLVDLRSDRDDRMPWLSPDGATLYFASNRSGSYALYRATRSAR